MTIAKLNRQLAAKRQWLPVDVPGRIGRPSAGPSPSMRSAPPLRLRHDARLPARVHRGGWNGDDVFGRGPGGEKRRRLQHMPVDGRLLGYAGRDHPGHADGPATAGGRRAAGLRAPRFRSGGKAAGRAGPLARPARGGRAGSRPRKTDLHPSDKPLFSGANPCSARVDGNACRLYVGFEGSAAEVGWMLDTLHEEWAASE